MKKQTEKCVDKAKKELSKSVQKVLERVIEAESRDATQEREMKEGLERLMKSLTARIEGLEKKQTDQDAMIKKN